MGAQNKMARPPKTFAEFIGQRRVVEYLARLIKGSKAQRIPCPSILLIGPSGCGKTVLAKALATEYGAQLHSVFAGNDVQAIDLCLLLRDVNHGDMVFVDEAHALQRDAQQIFLLALDESGIPRIVDRQLDRHARTSIAPFTLILATNEPGCVKPALRGRLRSIEFAPYSPRELTAIAKKAADDDKLEVTPQAARILAAAAQGSPRKIHRRLQDLKLFWSHAKRFRQRHVEDLLRHEGIDHHGLTPNQRQYLKLLSATPGSALSLQSLATTLGCGPKYVQEEIEVFLVAKGYVQVASGAGRKLTAEGRQMVREAISQCQKVGGAAR
jgi:Holliday junction DNA helicase RuvB